MRKNRILVSVPHFELVHTCRAALRLLVATGIFVFLAGFARADEIARVRVQVGVIGAGNVTPASGLFALGSTVIFSAKPSEGFVFSHWTDAACEPLSFDADLPKLRYIITGRAALNARFVRNPFPRFSTTVSCLMRTFAFMPETGLPTEAGRGLLAISFTKIGGFSGRMIFDGEVLLLKGAMNGLGKAHLRLARANGTTLRVELMMNLNNPASSLDVAVIGGDYCAFGSVAMTRLPAPAARSSIILPPAPEGQATPFESTGFASLVRDASGAYRGVGRLRDGTPLAFGGRVMRDHFEGVAALPLYRRLADGGILSGLIDFQTNRDPGERIGGTLQRQPAPVPAQTAPATEVPTLRTYVSPDGNDANSGSRDSPLRKLQTALTQISGEGEIVMLAGDYEGEKLDLATARKLTIRSEPARKVRVIFGEKVMGAAFTLHHGNVWETAVASVLPVQQSENRFWIFEMGTPQGAVLANPGGLHAIRNFRLDHFRLSQAPSLAWLDFTNGGYFQTNGILYLRTSNGEPPAPTQEFRIPSQNPADSFVSGATDQTDITLEGIEVYCGMNNVDFTGAGKYRVAGCKFFGAGNSGILAVNALIGIEEECEYAANANDGSSPVNGAEEPLHITVIDAWSHDNGDEGHSLHQHCRGYYFGGVFENNANGGITPAIGADAIILGTQTRENVGGISPSVAPGVNVLVSDWTSTRDFDAMEQWTGGLATVVDSKIENPRRYAFSAIVPASRMHVFNTAITGGQGINGGAGASGTVIKTDRVEYIPSQTGALAKNYPVEGSFQSPPRFGQRIEPFGNDAPNGRIEITTTDLDGLPVSLLQEDFYLDSANVIFIIGRNPQALRLVINPRTGVFNGVYRDKLHPEVRRTIEGAILQEQRLGAGQSLRGDMSDAVKVTPQ